MRLLVCGGGGYIGSHMCRLLAQQGHELFVADDFSTGHLEAVRWGKLYQGDLGNSEFTEQLFQEVRPEGVLHFAAKSIVSESTRDPALYYRSNVVVTLNILEQVRKIENCLFVFSSTAAIFGLPRAELVNEAHPKAPINTYGRSKLQIEEILQDYWSAYRIPSVCFRYFNAAGADWEAGIGESHEPETHLIPKLLESALGRGGTVSIFGEDYDTEDGTCVRDYIHVNDLCSAHFLGLQFLQRHRGAHAFNLGNGKGFSVKQIIKAAEEVTGQRLNIEVTDRRAGDPSRLVADSSSAIECLGWTPIHQDLNAIIDSAWKWHQNRRY